MEQQQRALRRELRTPGAVALGLGSILGTGVFVSIGYAASFAGGLVALAILLAGFVALCNGLSSAQLAAAHPVSGGTYEYGYRFLNPAMGFIAGWMFLCAKSASAAAAAIGFAAYLSAFFGGRTADPLFQTGIAVAAVIIIAGLVLTGVRKSNLINAIIVGAVLAALVAFIVIVPASAIGRGSFSPAELLSSGMHRTAQDAFAGLFTAAAIMFVAYTGYGRIATLGEEVIEPQRTIPRAVIATLAISALLYAGVAVAAVTFVEGGAARFAEIGAERDSPLAEVARGSGDVLPRLIAIAATIAMLSVLINLILGLSRVMLAMGRRRDMPAVTARIDAGGSTPWVAVLVVTLGITAIVIFGDFKLAWSFSAFTVLVYYGITNLAALRLDDAQRRFPRWIAVVGLVSCMALAVCVPLRAMLLGLALIAAGLLWHIAARLIRKRHL